MSMLVRPATDPAAWDTFLSAQPYSPFLQSWTMGDVYGDIGQQPVRLEMRDSEKLIGICFGHIVPARRGKHLAVPYGPVFDFSLQPAQFQVLLPLLYAALREAASAHGCSFIRMSPFLSPADGDALATGLRTGGAKPVASPLHLLAEHVWYLPLRLEDEWKVESGKLKVESTAARTEEEIFMQLRKTTRNLVRRAEKDGVTVEASSNPVEDLAYFIRLHDETRRRHKFTPYSNAFFRAQVARFAPRNEVTVYLARHAGEVIAASVHMHSGGETSYHHGASSSAHSKIPASYLVQWTAIKDALRRGDSIYNFWGIAPVREEEGSLKAENPAHPFAGVTLFKTGFGGSLLPLMHCIDLPLSGMYQITRLFEILRKRKRGF